jgi:hypothetical protein
VKFSFPWLATGIGLLLAMVLIGAGVLEDAAGRALPLLTLLFISEFGFFVTLAGSIFAGRALLRQGRSRSNLLLAFACGALAIAFFSLGILLWQGSVTP